MSWALANWREFVPLGEFAVMSYAEAEIDLGAAWVRIPHIIVADNSEFFVPRPPSMRPRLFTARPSSSAHKQVLENLKAALTAVGGSFEHVIKLMPVSPI